MVPTSAPLPLPRHAFFRGSTILAIITCALSDKKFSSFNGYGNNINNPTWGSSGIPTIRSYPPLAAYADGVSKPISDLPSARRIMEELFHNSKPQKDKNSNQLLLEFGHFVASDLIDSKASESELFNISCDGTITDTFCPGMRKVCNNNNNNNDMNYNQQIEIPFHRNVHATSDDQASKSPVNYQSSFLDLSNIYGLDKETVAAVRGDHGYGGISMDDNNLPPEEKVLANLWPGINSSPGKFALYVLFMRYHNLRATYHLKKHSASDDFFNIDSNSTTIFHLARMDTIAAYQQIVEEKYLPSVLGNILKPYKGYDPLINPTIDVFFSTVGFRYGHSSVASIFPIVDQKFIGTKNNPFVLRDIFEKIHKVYHVAEEDGIEAILRGLTTIAAKKVDISFVEDMNFWANATSLLDVQRSRDHGIPSYNVIRKYFGLSPVMTFRELVGDDLELVSTLESLYNKNVDKIDAYVGALIEPVEEEMDELGPTFQKSIINQFERLRDGDRFWYKNILSEDKVEELPSLSTIIDMTTKVEDVSPMVAFPSDPFILIQETSTWSNGHQKGEISSHIGVLDNELEIEWTLSEGNKKDLQITLLLNKEMTGNGYIGMGVGRIVMDDSTIWFCAVKRTTPKPSFSNDCPLEEDHTGRFFDCCAAKGHGHSVECIDASKEGKKFYMLNVIESCIMKEKATVTFIVPLCTAKEKGKDLKNCYDLVLNDEEIIDFIAAYNYLDQSRTHGPSRRSSGTIHLENPTRSNTVSVQKQSFFIVHGVFMLVAWLLLVPGGIFIVRYLKAYPWWTMGHIAIMGVVSSVVPASFFAHFATGVHPDLDSHKSIGFFVSFFFFVMIAAGRILLLRLDGKIRKERLSNIAFHLHQWGGFLILLLAWWNCYTGLVRIGPELTVDMGWVQPLGYNITFFGKIKKYYVYIVFMWVLVFVCAEYNKKYKSKMNKKSREESSKVWNEENFEELDEMDSKTFLDMTRYGYNLCIVDGLVIDIKDFIKLHPGGPQVLQYAQGCDITLEFLGRRSVNGQKHLHSNGAKKRLKNIAIAKLKKKSAEENKLMPLGYISKKNDENAFYQASILNIKYITPEKNFHVGLKTTVLLTVGIKKTSDEDSNHDKFIPTSAFTFRARDEKNNSFIERQYTPLYLSSKDECSSYISSMNKICKLNSKIEIYDFIISLLPDGQMSNLLIKKKANFKVSLQIQGPKINISSFNILNSKKWSKLVLVAAGSGISPMLQLIDHFLEKILSSDEESLCEPQIVLVWLLSDKESSYKYTKATRIDRKAQKLRGYLKWIVLFYESKTELPMTQQGVRIEHKYSIEGEKRRMPTAKMINSQLKKGETKNEKKELLGTQDIVHDKRHGHREENDGIEIELDGKIETKFDEKIKSLDQWSYKGEFLHCRFSKAFFQKLVESIFKVKSEDYISYDESLFAVSGPPDFEYLFMTCCKELGIEEDSIMPFTTAYD
uniref:Cytochrome b5 heme-binding domain-containing protein n=1 Tax=Corethron hystrix TaxID=216773 RepID=A0A7S1FVP3_9STRA|mmetsp:Transcript_32204/g.74158  ORF Transcript_32204/g.74158 Transcript_32204/m.74158 type:complete len:1459 (+) Transcript_32204:176-4552(+)